MLYAFPNKLLPNVLYRFYNHAQQKQSLEYFSCQIKPIHPSMSAQLILFLFCVWKEAKYKRRGLTQRKIRLFRI